MRLQNLRLHSSSGFAESLSCYPRSYLASQQINQLFILVPQGRKRCRLRVRAPPKRQNSRWTLGSLPLAVSRSEGPGPGAGSKSAGRGRSRLLGPQHWAGLPSLSQLPLHSPRAPHQPAAQQGTVSRQGTCGWTTQGRGWWSVCARWLATSCPREGL